MQTQSKLTPKEELHYLYELYGAGDHAKIYTILTDALNVLHSRSQMLLSLIAICLTITGFSGRQIAAANLFAKTGIGFGLAFVLVSALIILVGPLRIEWATQMRAGSVGETLLLLIERRNNRTTRYHLASVFLIIGLTGYVASVLEYLFQT
jgi:hypothetical protein